MMNIDQYMTDQGFDSIPKYRDTFGGYVTEYFKEKDRAAVIEDVDKFQVLTYYKDKFQHKEMNTYEEAVEFLRQVIV